MYLTFAWRYFKAKKSAHAINIIAWVTVGVIAFATACQILVLSVFNGFEDLVKSLYTSFYTDLKIVPAKGKTFILTADQISSIKKQNGIYGISLVAEEKALLKNEDIQTIVYLKGVDQRYSGISGVPSKTSQGQFNLGTADNPGLVVGYGIQSAAAINVSGSMQPSVVSIILPKKGYASIADPLQSLSEGNAIATGVFMIQQDFDNKYAFTNIDFVKQQMNFSADEYSAAEIKMNPDADIKTTRQSLLALLGTKDYSILTKYEQNSNLYNTMKLEKWFIYTVLTLILVIAAFNMISALTMLVLEKQRDISVLQSMGAYNSSILKIFLSEGLLLGCIGTAIGIVSAIVICLLQMHFEWIKLTGGSFLIDYFPVKLQISDFFLVSATALVIAFIASWIPAGKAAKQQIELRSA